jgi:membrane protease YdiL (CAAX protease family)
MQSRSIDRTTIMNITFVLEAVLLLASTFWLQVAQINLLPELRFSKNALIIGLLSGIGIASSGFLVAWLGNVFKDSLKWLHTLTKIIFEEIAPLFATLNFTDICIVAAASGFCEEIFFRGIVQSQIGLLPTSILFGFFHCPSKRHISYGIWALTAGLFLGWLRDWTGCLWVPIIAHALSNLIAIASLRYFFKPGSLSA